MNRLVKRIYPNGDEERFGYDANGNMVYKTRGRPAPEAPVDSVWYTYDARNREIRRVYDDGREVTTIYTDDGNRETVTDARGVTQYEYGG